MLNMRSLARTVSLSPGLLCDSLSYSLLCKHNTYVKMKELLGSEQDSVRTLHAISENQIQQLSRLQVILVINYCYYFIVVIHISI